MLQRTFLAAGIAVAAIVSAPASAAPEECQGEQATIVGTPDTSVLRGTHGRDVIVTRGAFEVQARDGNDLICVTDDDTGNVHAGSGDDEVHVTSPARGFVWTELGPGADTFYGGNGWDTVWAGVQREYPYQAPEDAQDAERDVIFSGGGADRVIVGEPDALFLDQVDTGAGDDWVTVMATVGDGTGILDLGLGFDQMDFEWPEVVGGDWLFDNGAEVVTEDGAAQFGWADVEGFDLPELGPNPVSFRGSDRSEYVEGGSIALVELGRGADGFSTGTNYFADQTPEPGLVDGGTGRDVFVVDTDDDVVVDLARGRVTFAENSHYMDDVLMSEFENVTAYAGRDVVEIRGDAGDNVIRANACRLIAAGAGGDDRVISSATDCWRRASAALRGGPGNDLLRGAGTPDRLRGGPGRDRMFGRGGDDVAHGGGGRDICAAEVRRSCALP